MIDFINLFIKIWPVAIGICAGLLYIGALHSMLNAHNRAITDLVKAVAKLSEFEVEQSQVNVENLRVFDGFTKMMENYAKAAETWRSNMDKRIDSIMGLMIK